MALIVPTLPPPRARQASVAVYPVPSPTRPKALPDKARSNTGLWRWYKIPEVRSVANWTAAGVSRVSFAPCLDLPGKTGDLCPPLVDSDGDVAEGVNPALARDAQALWSLVRSPSGGQADLWHTLALSLSVAADGWLFTYPAGPDLAFDPDAPDVWVALARHALAERSGAYEVDVGAEAKVKVPLDAGRAVRVFRSHPERPAHADSWVAAAERDLERLEAIYEAVAAVALSRMHAGVVLAPNNQDPRTPTAMTVDEVDRVLGKPLRQALDEQITEMVEASAAELDGYARAVPTVIGMDSELTDKVKWLELARSLDPELGKRIDDLRYRVAVCSPGPPEVLLGLGDTNHWNADAISTGDFQRGVQPDCELICDATTPHILRAGLVAMGHAATEVARVRVGYDPSALVDPPDRSEVAIKVHPTGAITDAELRDATGLGEYQGPDPEEMRRVLIRDLALANSAYAYLLPELGLPAPPVAAAPEPTPPPEPDPAEAPEVDEPVTRTDAALPGDEALGRRLAAINVRFEDRLAALCGAIVDQMVARAGTKVTQLSRKGPWAPVRDLLRAAPEDMRGSVPGVAALLAADGIDDMDLLGGALAAFAARFESEVTDAQRRAVRAAGGDWAEVEADAEVASAAAWALAGTLLISEARRRFDGELPAEGVGEGLGVEAFAIPALLVRRVAAVAGGGTDAGAAPTGGSMAALLGVATGPIAHEALRAGGRVIAGYLWDWGEEDRTPFPPHLDLHGAFSPNEDGFDGYAVGDHAGCRCQLVVVTRAADDEP